MISANPFTRIFTATQDFHDSFPIETIKRLIDGAQIQICSGQSAGSVFCKFSVSIHIIYVKIITLAMLWNVSLLLWIPMPKCYVWIQPI